MVKFSLCIAILLVLSSCTHTFQFTYTKKSGIEQLLVTKAVDEALQGISVDIKGAKLFVDVSCLMPDEQSYIKRAFTHKCLESGASVTEYPWDADYVLSVLVRVAGTDGDQFALGLPSIPVPLATTVATPAINFFTGIVQEGRVEMEVILYPPKGGLKEKLPPLSGKSYYKKYVILFIPFLSKDIP